VISALHLLWIIPVSALIGGLIFLRLWVISEPDECDPERCPYCVIDKENPL
jgi:hypothetical protein